MKQLSLFTIFIFCVTSHLWAQTQNRVPVLRQQLQNESSDSLRAYLLNEIAWELRNVAPLEADSLANAALLISEVKENNFILQIGLSKKILGALKAISGDKEAVKLYKEAIEILKQSNYFKDIASIQLLLGNFALKRGELDEAMESYYEGIRNTDHSNAPEVRAIIFTMVAKVKIQQRKYDEAEKIYQDAIDIQKTINAPIRLAKTYYSLGTLYSKIKKMDQALIYFNKAENIFVKNEAIATKELAAVFGAKGNVYLQKKDLDKVIKYYRKSLDIKEATKDTTSLPVAYYQIGNLLFIQKKYKEAKPYISSCLNIALKKKTVPIIAKAYKKLSKINEHNNNHTEALKNYKEHIIFQSQLLNEEKSKAITDVVEKYKNEQLQQENEQQAILAKRDRIIAGGIIFALLIIASILVMYYQQKGKLHQQAMFQIKQTTELRALNAAQDGQEKERKRIAEALHNSMGSLLSAIQIHFQTIIENVTFQQKDTQLLFKKSLQLVKEAGETNRNIAHEMMPPILMKFGIGASLGALAEKIESPGISVTTSVYGLEKRLPEQLELSLYRIIDELINNILKHAKASEVNIQLTEHEDELNIIIEDNGVGFNYDPNNQNYGMGLSNIMTRVNHFKGEFEIDSSEGNGTTIIINIPTDTVSIGRF